MARSDFPRISVITPSLNQAPFLEQAIESVLDQDYPNLEYIVVDGASTDGSVEILERYESRMARWVSEPDGGQTQAINKGFRMASGELVAWLNADDFYLPDALNAVAASYRKAKEASKVGFLFGRGVRVDRAGNPLGDFWPHAPAFDLSALKYGFDCILQPATVMVRSALEAVGYLDERLNWCMDYDLWMRLGESYRAIPVDHPVAASREYPETKSLSGGLDRIAEIARVIHRHAGIPLSPGVLYYLTTTLRTLTESDALRDLFTDDFRRCLELLYEESLVPLSVFSEKSPGFPEREGGEGTARGRMARRVTEHCGVLARLESELERLHRIVAERDAQLADLSTRFSDLGIRLGASEADRAARLRAMARAEERLARLDAELAEVNAAAAELRLVAGEFRERAERAENTLATLRNAFPVRLARSLGLVD